jgi:hypothetical protein
MKGPILEHYLEKGPTVNSATYSAIIFNVRHPHWLIDHKYIQTDPDLRSSDIHRSGLT